MAASKPSEYEKPPIGTAGEASQMSWSNAGVAAGELADAAVATAPTSVVMLAMGAMHVAFCRAMCVVMCMVMCVVVAVVVRTMRMPVAAVRAAFGLKRFVHRHHSHVHGTQHVGQHMVGLNLQVVGLQLNRHMAVAKVIGRARQIKR